MMIVNEKKFLELFIEESRKKEIQCYLDGLISQWEAGRGDSPFNFWDLLGESPRNYLWDKEPLHSLYARFQRKGSINPKKAAASAAGRILKIALHQRTQKYFSTDEAGGKSYKRVE